MHKKLRDKSQFLPIFEHIDLNLVFQSQTGEYYNLAKLGSVDEFYDRLAKYDRIDLPLNLRAARKSIDYFLDRIAPCKTRSFAEAFEDLDMSKSIGFGAQSTKIFSRRDPAMLEYMKGYITCISDSTHNVVINASQKDELRAAGKTPRLFTAFPPEHTLAATMVLGDFCEKFRSNRFCSNLTISTVGDSIQKGACAFYKHELDKRPYLYCTDTSGQDSSVSAEFLHLVYDSIRTKYNYTEEEERIFESVKHNSINKMVNVNGDIYLVPRGLGSGDYLTIIVNIMWRLYMIFDNYKYELDTYFDHNTTIICGDDLIMSSDYDDLDLNSRHAIIEWAGKPVTWKEMDFCSVSFYPYIHHDKKKVEAVLNLRKSASHMLSPEMEIQRLGGILRVLVDKEMYMGIITRMQTIVKKHPSLQYVYEEQFVTYEELFAEYNSPFLYY